MTEQLRVSLFICVAVLAWLGTAIAVGHVAKDAKINPTKVVFSDECETEKARKEQAESDFNDSINSVYGE